MNPKKGIKFVCLLICISFFITSFGWSQVDPDPWQDPEYYATGGQPRAVAIGDLNGDGHMDVAMTFALNSSNPPLSRTLVVFLYDTNTGLLVQQTPSYDAGSTGHPMQGESLDIGDLNGDGLDDVVVPCEVGIGVFYQNSGGTLNPMQFFLNYDHNPDPFIDDYRSPRRVRIIRIDNNGLADVIADGSTSPYLYAFINNGTGFNTPTASDVYLIGFEGYDLQVGDLNGDGYPDAATCSATGAGTRPRIAVLQRLASGGFDPVVYYPLTGSGLVEGLAIGDLNMDGRNDLVASNAFSNVATIFYQDASGSLGTIDTIPTIANDGPRLIANIAGDVHPDIIEGWEGLITLKPQEADNTFPHEWSYTYHAGGVGKLQAHSLAVGHLNEDTLPDLAISCLGQLVVFYGQEGGGTGPQPRPQPDEDSELPTARITGPPYVYVGTKVKLSGTHSFNPGGFLREFRWGLERKPSGSSARLSSTTAKTTSFIADKVGTYLATLMVKGTFSKWSNKQKLYIKATKGLPPEITLKKEVKTVEAYIIKKKYAIIYTTIMPSDEVPASVSKYLLYKKIDEGDWELKEDITGKLVHDERFDIYNYTYKGNFLQKGKTYTYKVVIINTDNEEIAAAEISVTGD